MAWIKIMGSAKDKMFDNELGNLPSEAFSPFGGPVEFDNFWLQNASTDDQKTAVKEWFMARYCDPSLLLPYDSREGGFQYIHGGPCDPDDVIHTRFGRVIPDDVLEEVVEFFHSEVGYNWTPNGCNYDGFDEYAFDARFDLALLTRDEPLARLRERLEHAQRLLSLEGNAAAKALAEQLVYSSVITSLEAYLWETADYWVEHNDDVMRNLVTKLEALRDIPLKLGDIFEKYDVLNKLVRGYLQNIVWHRFADVARLYKAAFDIKLPSLRPFIDALEKRHHIVHRSGYDHERNPVVVTVDEIVQLCASVEQFGVELDGMLKSWQQPRSK